MRIVGQLASVLAVAFGVGLLTAGGLVGPVFQAEPVGPTMPSIGWSTRETEFYLNLFMALKGFGAGFLTLGILGLLVPWANVLIYGRQTATPAKTESATTSV